MACKVIFWISYQQKTVALFSTEAEYMALSNCGHQLVWTRNLLNEVNFNVLTPYLYSNNFFEDLILYRRNTPNILIFSITM